MTVIIILGIRVVCDFVVLSVYFFFFTQKTAYEMRISDWSSDVCSSDLVERTRRKVPSGSRTQLCASSLKLAIMIWSRTCWWTVAFSMGIKVSLRRSRLRGIQSAEEMKTLACRDGSDLPLPKPTIRLCSRNRPTMLFTRMFSESTGTPGQIG